MTNPFAFTTKLYIDIGNYAIKVADELGATMQIRSLYHRLLFGEKRKSVGTDESPLINYDGSNYQVGNLAAEYTTRPSAFVTQDKTSLQLILLAICASYRSAAEFEELELNLSVPNEQVDTEQLSAELAGRSLSFIRNGRQHSLTIKKVTFHFETQVSYYYLASQNLIDTQDNYGVSGILDVGGGTANFSIVKNHSGEVVRTASVKNGGVVALTRLLIQNDGFIRLIGTHGSVSMLMDQIAIGRLRYGGKDYSSFYADAKRQWAQNLKMALSEALAEDNDLELTGLFVIGAFAQEVSNLLPSFTVVPQPHLANVLGMFNKGSKA